MSYLSNDRLLSGWRIEMLCLIPRERWAWLGIFLVIMAGCTTSPTDDETFEVRAIGLSQAAEPIESGTAAMIYLDQASESIPEGSLGQSTKQKVIVAFAGYDGDAAYGLEVLDLLSGHREMKIDTCLNGQAERLLGDAAPHDQVELWGAGQVSLLRAGQRTPIPPRTFPAIGNIAGGVFYATDRILNGEAPASDGSSEFVDKKNNWTFFVEASGNAAVPPFRTQLSSPHRDLQLKTNAAPADSIEPIQVSSGMQLSWTEVGITPPAASNQSADIKTQRQAGDYVEIEVYSQSTSIICRATDDGAFDIPSTLFGAVLSGSEPATLVFRRTREEALALPNIDQAFARVKTTQAYAIALSE